MSNNNNKNNVLVLCVVLALAVTFTVAPCRADTPLNKITPVSLYAVGAGQWVRIHRAYPTNPVRAADGISKSDATRFVFQYTWGQPDIDITLPSETKFFDKDLPHDFPKPVDGVVGWDNGTLLAQGSYTLGGAWSRIISAQGKTELYEGDSVYILNLLNGRYCTAPTWPTNKAALVCTSSQATDYQKFNVHTNL